MKKKFQQLYSYGITNILFAIILLLTILSAYNTCYVNIDNYADEHVYFLPDNILLNIIAFLLLIAIVYLVSKSKHAKAFINQIENNDAFFNKCKKVLLLIIFVMGFIWVMSTQYAPRADQVKIQNAVYALHQKDNSLFFEGSYIAKCQNQLGLLLFSYMFSFIFGSNNYIAFQLLNVASVTFIYKCLSEISGVFGFKKTEQLITILLGILFFPLIMYSSFIYGNLLGLLFSLLAVKHELLYFTNEKKKDLILSALYIAFAIALKTNHVIFMIGMVIYAAYEIFQSKKWKNITIIVAILIMYVIQLFVPSMIIKNMTGTNMGDGISSLAYIAMGFQDGKRAPGWYNGYNHTLYAKANYDKDTQNKMSKEAIATSFKQFKIDPQYAGQFFIQKIASMYAEPSFQSFWIVQFDKQEIEIADWSWSFTTANGSNKVIKFLNLFQFLIYAGVILYCICCRKNSSYAMPLLLPMIFIGGFIFHMFWEAKSQYTISYYVLLFPYAVSGYRAAVNKTCPKKLLKNNIDLTIITILMTIVIFILSQNDIMSVLTSDKDAYIEYLKDERISDNKAIKDGTYKIKTSIDNLVLSAVNIPDSDNYEITLLEYNKNDNNLFKIATYQGKTRICLPQSNHYFEYGSNIGNNMHKPELKGSSLTSKKQKWILRVTENNDNFYIMYNENEALTFNTDTGEVYIGEYTGEANQQWYIEK